MGFLERYGSEDENLDEMGEGCFISRRGEGNRGMKRGRSPGCAICLAGMKELAQALWVNCLATEGGGGLL